MRNPEPLLPYADEDFALYGDPPSPEEEALAAEIGYLIWSFRKVAMPGVFVAFELRNAVGAFTSRSKLPLDTDDAAQLKAAVGIALRAALKHPDTKRMCYLRRGMAAICEAIDARADPGNGDHATFLRNIHIKMLKHEIAMIDLATVVACYTPAAWSRRHRDALAADEPLFA